MDQCEIKIKEMNDGLPSVIECPVCLDPMVPHLYMCKNGHSVCIANRGRNVLCSTCGANFAGINLTTDKVAELMPYSCRYEADGCPVKLRFKDKKAHEEDCDFRPFRCLFASCDWKLCRLDYFRHLEIDHKIKLVVGPNQIIAVPLVKGNSEWLLHAFDRYFMFRFTIDGTNIYLRTTVYFEGEFDESAKYYFNFYVKHHTDPHNSIEYTCTPDSLEMGQFVLSFHVAKMYCLQTERNLLPIQVTVHQITSEKEEKQQKEEEEKEEEDEKKKKKKKKKKQKTKKEEQEEAEEEAKKQKEEKVVKKEEEKKQEE